MSYVIPTSVLIRTQHITQLTRVSRQKDNPHTRHNTDTFSSYLHRSTCPISSLQLHQSSNALCTTRSSLLTAMSSGGRIGFDAPYMCRDCDMRWFTSDEVCEILGRFDRVVLVGDSMIRHVMGALMVLVRRDLGYGAVTGWNFDEEER